MTASIIDFLGKKREKEVEKQFYDNPLDIIELVLELPTNCCLLITNVDGRLRINKIGIRFEV